MADKSYVRKMTTLFGGKCAFDRPAISINPLRNCCSAKTCLSGPITERHCLIAKGQHSSAAFVAALFMLSFPAHIAGLVSICVVNASKRMMLAWRVSHVMQEVFKLLPSFAYGNANTAVSVVSLHRRVFASANHRIPRLPFFGSVSANRVSMSSHVNSKSVMRSHYMHRLGVV